jgi:hypothetical protein
MRTPCRRPPPLPTRPPALGRGCLPDRYEEVFERVRREVEKRQAALATDRRTAAGWAERLAAMPPLRRRLLIDNRPALATWALCEQLLDGADRRLAGAAAAPDAGAARDLARLALTVAGRLDAAYYGPARVADLTARAWSMLGQALGRLGDPETGAAFSAAERELAAGTGEPIEVAELSARRAAARYPAALDRGRPG